MKLYIIAGEASGDLHGSNLIKALKVLEPNIECRVWGGDLMQAAGGTLVKHYRDLAFMGFLEVVKNLRTIFRNLDFCKQDILDYQPDALVLIDYPGFNLRMAKWAKQQGIKVIYYISPQIWAWHSSRVHAIKRDVDKMLVILPFEQDFYKKYGMEAAFVGHPLLDAVEGGRSTVDGVDCTADGRRLTVDGVDCTVEGGRSTVDGVESTTDSGQLPPENQGHEVHATPSTVNRQPSTVQSTPSTVDRLPSAVQSTPSTVDRPPSTVQSTPSTVYHQPSTVVALLPGSRKQEVSKILPEMLSVTPDFPEYQFIIAAATSLPEAFYEPFLTNYPNVSMVRGKTYDLLRSAKAALVKSGTSTLETALFDVPQVVCYAGNPISYMIARRLVNVKYISLVNLIMDRPLVKELIQVELNTKNIREALKEILDPEYAANLRQGYAELRHQLGDGGASEKAAKAVLASVKG